MKITLVMVQSINGKITRGDDSNVPAWTSAEDTEHFYTMIDHAPLIIMGRHTYEAAKSSIKHKDGTLRVVVTSSPNNYQSEKVPHTLEFTDEKPEALVGRLEKVGYTHGLLVGGGVLNSAFLSVGLVDDIYLTVEPHMFGVGRPLFEDSNLDISLKLLESKKLNNQGTLLLHYQVVKTSKI